MNSLLNALCIVAVSVVISVGFVMKVEADNLATIKMLSDRINVLEKGVGGAPVAVPPVPAR